MILKKYMYIEKLHRIIIYNIFEYFYIYNLYKKIEIWINYIWKKNI